MLDISRDSFIGSLFLSADSKIYHELAKELQELSNCYKLEEHVKELENNQVSNKDSLDNYS